MKGTHPPFINSYNNYATKQELSGQYYKTLFISRFMEIPYQYETRHKALLGIDWNKSNECQRNEHTLWRIWQPNDNCKLIPKNNIWPNYNIYEKQFVGE